MRTVVAVAVTLTLGVALHAEETAPRLISKVEPECTTEARDAKVNDIVALEVEVDARGVPRIKKVLEPLGYGLDQEASASAREWRFEPGTKEGKPVPVEARIEMAFRCNY